MAPETPHHHTIIPQVLACIHGDFLRYRVSPATVVGLLDEQPATHSPFPERLGDQVPCLTSREGRSFRRKEGRRGAMSRNNGKGPRLELKLDLSLATRGSTSARVAAEGDSPNGTLSSSPPSSCLSSCSNSPEATSMVLAGCPRCLMYVMLSEVDPKCPKCKSAVLLDFLHGGSSSSSSSNTTTTTATTTTTTTTNNNNNNNGKSKTRKS